MYRQLYAPNPFIGHSEQDLQQYLREVAKKSKSNSKCAGDNDNTITGVSSLPSSPSFPPLTKMPESPTMGGQCFGDMHINGICPLNIISADRASLMQAVARVKMNGKNGLERSASGDDAGKDNAKLNNGKSKNEAEKDVRKIFCLWNMQIPFRVEATRNKRSNEGAYSSLAERRVAKQDS